MKKFNIVCLVLLFVMTLASCGNNNLKATATEYTYEINEDITDINVNWRIGDIIVTSGDSFIITETSLDENNIIPLSYTINDNKLNISSNKESKTLNITLPKGINYQSIIIKNLSGIIDLFKIDAETISLSSKVGMCNVHVCTADTFEAVFGTLENWPVSRIQNNTFKSAYISYERIHMIQFDHNIYDKCELNIGYTNLRFHSNNSTESNIYLLSGEILIYNQVSRGFTLNGQAKTTLIDFETLSYNGKVIYGDGSHILNCKNTHGSIVISKI